VNESQTRIEQSSSSPVVKRVNLLSLARVVPAGVEWLWPGRIPAGKMSLLAGDPGRGKSLLSLDIAARVSRGLAWPDAPQGAPAPMGRVVLLSPEDNLADTVRPRLDAAGADPAAVVEMRMDGRGEFASGRVFSLARNLDALEQAVVAFKNVRLVVVDPVTAFLGRLMAQRDGDVHGLLVGLSGIAERTGAAILAITHLSRKGAASVLYRVAGSPAFGAAARTVWAVTADLDDPERHLFVPVKNNLSAQGTGLAFRLVAPPGGPSVPRLAWEEGPVAVSAAEALGAMAPAPWEGRAAAAWLRVVLADGPLACQAIARRAQAAGVSWAAVRRAKGLLGVVPYSTGYQDRWMWRLAEQSAEAGSESATAGLPRRVEEERTSTAGQASRGTSEAESRRCAAGPEAAAAAGAGLSPAPRAQCCASA